MSLNREGMSQRGAHVSDWVILEMRDWMNAPAQADLLRGFSLLEAMMSGAILAIVLTAVASSMSHIAGFIAMQNLKRQAQLTCQSHLESILAIEYERPVSHEDCMPVVYSTSAKGDDNGTLIATCRIVPDRPTEGYARLMVEVVAERDGRQLRSRLATYLVMP